MAKQTLPAPAPDTEVSPPADTAILGGTAITNSQIANWFTDHKPDAEAVDRMTRIRKAGAALAQIIKDNTSGSADQAEAIRKVREAVMTAHAAVVCKGR